MREFIEKSILIIYDSILGLGAIVYGYQMLSGSWFEGEWPKEWIGRVPFRSWFWPGIIAIVIFGFGNLFSAYYSIYKEEKFYIPSLIMGVVFLLSFIASIFILGESYLATGIFIILASIQIIVSLIYLILYRNKYKI